jgi:hypothetical protein
MRKDAMIRYEVRAELRAEDADRYASYLKTQHIPDLMNTGCFVEASLEHREGGHFRTVYLAPDVAALDRYLATFAPALRAHALEKFPEGLTLSREVWTVVQRWTAPPALAPGDAR